MRYKLIACEVLYREFCAVIARSSHQVDVEFLPKGLHDAGQEKMSARLAEATAAVDPSHYDAVLLGYALCSNGVVGLRAASIPLVIPRAHDCITLLLGSKERYLDYFQGNPGVYFKSSGWIERGDDLRQLQQDSIQQRSGINQTYEEMVARYGEDNARFLREQLGDLTRHYRKVAFIEMGVGPQAQFLEQARREAAEGGWEFEQLHGDLALIADLVEGKWDAERFLVVEPGYCVAASFDEGIVKAVKTDQQ